MEVMEFLGSVGSIASFRKITESHSGGHRSEGEQKDLVLGYAAIMFVLVDRCGHLDAVVRTGHRGSHCSLSLLITDPSVSGPYVLARTTPLIVSVVCFRCTVL